MAYSVADDVRKVVSPDGEDTMDSPAGYTDAALEDCIARADAQIDNYLRGVYTVPVAVPDATLRDWSSVIAAWMATMVQANGADVDNTDPIQRRYDRVIADLKLVMGGQMILSYPLQTDEEQIGDLSGVNRYEGDLFASSEFFDSSDPLRYRNLNTASLPWEEC